MTLKKEDYAILHMKGHLSEKGLNHYIGFLKEKIIDYQDDFNKELCAEAQTEKDVAEVEARDDYVQKQ